MATNQKAAKLLAEALELMNNNGAHWTQGNLTDRHPVTGEMRYCSIGAISKFAKDGIVTDRAIDALAHGLPNGGSPFPAGRIVYWNDNPRRKWPDIVKRFTKAIERLEKA